LGATKCWEAAKQVASQEGLSFMKLVKTHVCQDGANESCLEIVVGE
jgi:hypothetical protein